jgi:hypothetical protein
VLGGWLTLPCRNRGSNAAAEAAEIPECSFIVAERARGADSTGDHQLDAVGAVVLRRRMRRDELRALRPRRLFGFCGLTGGVLCSRTVFNDPGRYELPPVTAKLALSDSRE